ncbi:MAG: hypothetical protein LQ339_008744 [Xanthoria mediterranea]|nr:MAG: hypothetical protein LQ339_008744 [Xanthoria mediterranea]
MSDQICFELVEQLASGFGALLEQVQELDTKNANLEHLLDRMQKQIQDNNLASSLDRSSNTLPTVDPHISGEDSGLHIECEDTQLHLNRVPRETKWLIADGFKAWNKVRSGGIGQYLGANHLMRKHPNESNDPRSANPTMANDNVQGCPFAALQSTVPNPHTVPSTQDGVTSRERALPNGTVEDPMAPEHHGADVSSLVASQTGSASKCPIRFLDQHSPEEVAEYFKNHRHEIPRSHEICVKRYQKNEDQIRQLDHKYGSLVSMIQGLGQKHQPMLHTKNAEENISQTRTSQDIKVEEWAHEVDGDDHKLPEIKSMPEDIETKAEERTGHFDRPLKDIRVGESPSRPWGISVPLGAHIPASAADDHEKRDVAHSNRPEPPTPLLASPIGREEQGVLKPSEAGQRQPSMLFTGPVFIGYAPDQIADILQRTGLGKEERPLEI